MTDTINPKYYQRGGIHVDDFIEAYELGYRLGNVVKYLARCERKGSKLTDLKKAKWYLEREIQRLKQQASNDIIMMEKEEH